MEKAVLTVEKERASFTKLLVSNPNYFGNLPQSTVKAVKLIAANTKYEEITCVGFNPDTNRLEATVAVKLPSGYGGSLCGDGTTEHVRFFIDYGTGWEDAGLAAFKAHDIPDGKDCAKRSKKPLSYVVTQSIDPKKEHCKKPVLPKVRAILSWQSEPPAGDPNWTPVWGNVLERDIQIKPRFWYILELMEVLNAGLLDKIELPLELLELQYKPLILPDPPSCSVAELAELYVPESTEEGAVNIEVEPHRFGFEDIQAVMGQAGVAQDTLSLKIDEWKELGMDFSAAYELLEVTKGNVEYEELDCVGLDYNLEQLVATFRIKRSSGYSGNLCKAGSQEYVAFWADWDDKCQWTYLGTASVNVHDIASIPGGDLHYSAFLPVDLTHHRRNCDNPKIGRVRAVLSWASSPSTTDPDEVPYWGNRLDRHVQIRPGESIPQGTIRPLYHRIGGIRDDDIHSTTGLTLPTATFDNGSSADSSGRTCPFAERVVITGPSFPGHHYRIQVRKVGEPTWVSLVNKIWVEPLIGLKYSKLPVLAGEYYSYETLSNNPDLTLGWWETSGDDLWDVKLDIFGQAGSVIQRVRLKNSGIEDIRIHISSSGDCAKFIVGDTLTGALVARDPYFGHYSLYTLPYAAPAGQLSPTSGTVQTPSAPPEPAPPPGGTSWTLKTTGMKPCGYVLKLDVVDRAIRRSVPTRHWASRSVGFCLLKKK